MALSPLREQIATLYAANLPGTAIAAQLQIPLKRVYRAYANSEVKARIAELTQQTLEEMGISVEMVLTGVGDIAFDPLETAQNRLRAFELIGKHLGMFVDKVEDVTQRRHDEWIKMIHVEITSDDLSFLD